MHVSERFTLYQLRTIIMIGAILAVMVGVFTSTASAQSDDTLRLPRLNPGDLSAYRWQAMADYYTAHPLATDLTTYSAGDAAAYRWQAMAGYYTAHPLATDLRTYSAGDASAYRWRAMAEYYTE